MGKKVRGVLMYCAHTRAHFITAKVYGVNLLILRDLHEVRTNVLLFSLIKPQKNFTKRFEKFFACLPCRKIAENCRKISPIYTLLRVGFPRAPCCYMLQLCGCAEWGKRNGQAASQLPARVFSMKKFWSAALAPHGAGGYCQKLVLINLNNYIIDCY